LWLWGKNSLGIIRPQKNWPAGAREKVAQADQSQAASALMGGLFFNAVFTAKSRW